MKKIILLFGALVSMSAMAQDAETLKVATLEDVVLGSDSHIPVFTEDFDDEVGFQSGDFWFDMNTMSDWATWWGYGVANHTATDFNSLDDQFNSCVGNGYDKSVNYGVAYVGDFMGPVYVTLSTDDAAVVPGVYVTNAAYAMASMLNGDSYAKKFGKGDWFKLTATGYDDDEATTGSVDFYLADLRSDDEDDWYVVNDWKYFDLSTLGKVRQIKFTLSSTDNSTSGMNTPAYFCYDNMGAEGTQVAPSGNWKELVPSTPTAISTPSSSIVSVEYYTISGQKLEAPQHGLMIIRVVYADGKTTTVKKLY